MVKAGGIEIGADVTIGLLQNAAELGGMLSGCRSARKGASNGPLLLFLCARGRAPASLYARHLAKTYSASFESNSASFESNSASFESLFAPKRAFSVRAKIAPGSVISFSFPIFVTHFGSPEVVLFGHCITIRSQTPTVLSRFRCHFCRLCAARSLFECENALRCDFCL